MSVVTCIAPVNIAVIKYWGKRDEKLNLPINDSISASLDTEHLCAKTTIMASPDFKEDKLWLNGREESIENPRVQNCLREMRKRAQLTDETMKWKIHICSENNFPTAAGLASSAAGYACMAVALAKLYKVEGDISAVARAGSGSACRSVYGGFVRWYMGSDPHGTDSIARPIAPASYWPEMRICVLVVNDSKKKVASTLGMKTTLLTSEFLKYRVEKLLPARLNQIQKAILTKDFETFAKLTMKDSNQMHAACLETYPPCVYMNDISHLVVDLIHCYNDASNRIKAAYTFDAGPNATVYILEKDVPEFLSVIDHYFPAAENVDVEYKKGIPVESTRLSQELIQDINFTRQQPGKFKYIIHTRVGDGPKQLTGCESHLLNDSGLPIKPLVTKS